MTTPSIDIYAGPPETPEDYLQEHFSDYFMHVEAGETTAEEKDDGEWTYRTYACVPPEDKPTIWITDEIALNFDICGWFTSQPYGTRLYIIADIEDVHPEYDEYWFDADHWMTTEEIKKHTEDFAKKVCAKLIARLKVPATFWTGVNREELYNGMEK